MVLGLKPLGKPTTYKKIQVLDRTKALYGLRTQASGETKYLKGKTTLHGPLNLSEEDSPLTIGLIPKLQGFPSLLSDPWYQRD